MAGNNTLTVPVLALETDWHNPEQQGLPPLVKLYHFNRRLVVGQKSLLIYDGSLLNRKLSFDEPIISAAYTTFHDTADVLAVCLRKAAHLFYPDGRSYVVSFPFSIARALPFEAGLVLDKDPLTAAAETDRGHPLADSKFLTVVDPIGTFKTIAASSVSVISPNEELVLFPDRSINNNRSLCVTFNSHEKSIILYNVRLSARLTRNLSTYGSGTAATTGSGTGSNSTTAGPISGARHLSKRKYSVLANQNPSRMFEDEAERDQTHLSINMEKKRTSTLLSDASSMARMRSEPGIASHDTKTDHAFEYGTFQKDMILAKLETFKLKVDIANVSLHSVSYEDQEAIVLVDRINKEAKVFIFKHLLNTPMYQASYSFQCMDCIPLEESYVIVLKEPNQLCLVNLFLDVMSPKVTLPSSFPQIERFGSSAENDVTLVDHSGTTHLLHFVMQPSSEFVLRCLSCFKYLAGSRLEETIWMMWRTALMLDNCKNEWNAFVITLLALIFPFNDSSDSTQYIQNEVTVLLEKAKFMGEAFKADYNIPDMIPYIALALHLIREEARLDIFATKDLFRLNVLMTQLTAWMGWPESWSSYYGINYKFIDKRTTFLLVLILEQPPNLMESLVSLFSSQIVKYLTFSQLVEEGESADELITPRTHYTLKLFEILVSPNYGPGYIVDMMCAFGIDMAKLETYPSGISIPLKNAILQCQEDTSFEWTEKSLAITGRKDLQMLFSYDPVEYTPHPKHQPKEYNAILSSLTDKNDSMVAWDGQSEADRINVTKLIFDKDRRFYEITTLLHQTKIQTATLVPKGEISEYDLLLQQRQLAVIVALRTLTIPMGRAALFYGSRKPILTERFPIPKFNLNCLIAPSMTNIVLTEKSIDENVTEWGYFHNGVSSGLSINKDSNGISGSWIIFNKPNELNAQHAGFLLGIGLNGHLKRLEEWHIYNYLGPKHPLTSVGLLIGMAASLRGTMDNKLTKVLSVHAVALLPQGANDLNVPVVVQTAGLVGIGLLYLETQHRRMSEILLAQVTSSVYQNDTEIIHEGYRFSAGLSLGLVNLGKGDDLSGLNDTHVVEKLLLLATSMKDFQPVQELDKSCCGSILALAFIYLRTHNISVAEKLRVPQSDQFLDYIRPDLLLLRCLARNLILWDDIGNTLSWVKTQIPSSVWSKHSSLKKLDSDHVAYLNLMGGACLSIAIKYASTGDIVARDTILYFMGQLNKYTQLVPTNYDKRIVLRCAQNMQNLLALSVSIVMTGSGDLETLRFLRIMYHDTQSKGFGSYMAINMALGFLFLGDGQYAFSNSNFAIACLVISVYPIFPSQENENDMHLQALRHLWALAIEPRCLVVRDVVTQKPLKVPVQVRMKSGVTKSVTSPCLLPNIEEIAGVETIASDYFKVSVSLDGQFRDLFRKSMTVYVYKKTNFEMLKQSVGALLANESKEMQIRNGEVEVDPIVEWFVKGSHFAAIPPFERHVMSHELGESGNQGEWAMQYNDTNGLSVFNIIDTKLELQTRASRPQGMEDLWNLKLLFAYTDHLGSAQMDYILYEFVQSIKQAVWGIRG